MVFGCPIHYLPNFLGEKAIGVEWTRQRIAEIPN
jgi:hypothetical protein